jgi:hypothetical protein
MMEEKQRKRAMRFGRKNLEGIYRLDAGVWRGPGEQIIPLTSLQQKIALLFLESPAYRLSADQIQEKLNGTASDGDPTAYRKHVSLLNAAFGFQLLENQRNSGSAGGDSRNKRALYFLSPIIEFVQPPVAKCPPVEGALSIPFGEWRLEESPPAALLRAEFCVVPFFGRTTEISRIDDWRDLGTDLAVALVTGVGGRGKTRLAIESCRRAERKRWSAGFTSPQGLEDLLKRSDAPDHLFIVVDYAESNSQEIAGCLSFPSEWVRQTGKKVRILLLARSAGEWWETVRSSSDELSRLLHHPVRFLRLPLKELVQDADDSQALFEDARNAFRAKLRGTASQHGEGLTPFSNEALILFSQALLLELGETDVPADQETLFDYLLSRERRFWLRTLATNGIDKVYVDLFEQLVATLTLSGGTNSSLETRQLLNGFAENTSLDTVTREGFLIALGSVYGRDAGVEPLQPDLLGEYLVAKHLRPELIALAAFRNRI